MNVIEIKNLTKLYGNGRGIKNLNLTVEQGDILGLLGPNGSGKTTAMKAIDRKSTRLNSSHVALSRMPSSA